MEAWHAVNRTCVSARGSHRERVPHVEEHADLRVEGLEGEAGADSER